ncbi:MAG: haloacid dehalogenase-like hydrolase [Rhodoferax sp.]|nr:haloacid dehalogenase-like hydrolase [Rhodoferax sp.]
MSVIASNSTPSPVAPGGPVLQHWPREAAQRLEALIAAHAHQGAFAVFDADNTTYHHDLVGSLLPFMEARGVLTRETMHPSLKIIPFRDSAGHRESLHSYYFRLGEIDDQVGYPWASQIFAGFTLRELKGHLDDMLASGETIPAQFYEGDTLVQIQVEPPRLQRGQQELYNLLMRHGIEVFVVSAAAEELVRMVLADPKYGYNVKPQNVIGVSLLLKDRRTGELTTARKRITQQRYVPDELLDHELTHTLWAPMPWYEGKQAAIHTYIHPWKKPVLVAGDTPASDGPMLFRGPDTEQGGLRIFVVRKPDYHDRIHAMQAEHAEAQRAHGHPVTADRNWILVTPEQLR